MNHIEFRKKWKSYMEDLGHKQIPSMPLPSYSDPTLLFVNSGMFPLVAYLEGQPHQLGERLYNVQRCLRPMEFDGIGDNRHTSVFEMLGNWSLNDYFKKEQLENFYTFLIGDLGLDPKRLYATVFMGDSDAPRDEESIIILKNIFKKYNVEAEVAPNNYASLAFNEEIDLNKFRIFPNDKKENWWQRGDALGELGGPDSETFYDLRIDHDDKKWGYPHPATDSGRFIEIGNSVFMQYKKIELGWQELSQKNVDFGGGLERLLMVVNNKTDIFSTDLYQEAINIIEKESGIKYEPNESDLTKQIIAFRVITDHIKASVFMLGDGVLPSNKEQGYILRRALRRSMRFAKYLSIEKSLLPAVAETFIKVYKDIYPHLVENQENILSEIQKEGNKFSKTLLIAHKELVKKTPFIVENYKTGNMQNVVKTISSIEQTNGYPSDLLIEDLIDSNSLELNADQILELKDAISKETEKHKELSRGGAAKRFKGGLADSKELTVAYHSCAHLLLKALQICVDLNIHQKGQNITDERLRYDINLERALTKDEIVEIETLVNNWINLNLNVIIENHKKSDLDSIGAEASFLDRYPDEITIYKFVDPKSNEIISFEVCGGPHVKNTSEIKEFGIFKIVKEESVGLGTRRLRVQLLKD